MRLEDIGELFGDSTEAAEFEKSTSYENGEVLREPDEKGSASAARVDAVKT
jgi:hypothetical protein